MEGVRLDRYGTSVLTVIGQHAPKRGCPSRTLYSRGRQTEARSRGIPKGSCEGVDGHALDTLELQVATSGLPKGSLDRRVNNLFVALNI